MGNTRFRMSMIFVIGWGSLGLCGCETPPGAAREFPYGMNAGASRLVLDTVPRPAAQPVAESVFKEHFRIDADLSSTYDIYSQPKEIDPRSVEGKRIRDVLAATPNRIRQRAHLWLVQEGANTSVYCQVLLQRRDTAERAAFANEKRGDDRPDDTPIERRGTTGVQAEEEWVSAGRHRQTEKQMLDAIQKEFSE